MTDEQTEFEDEEDSSLEEDSIRRFSEAVLYSTDWTVDSLLNQLDRKNIQLNPKFQRRDAWSVFRKSLFIESIVIGLTIPQLVLAELRDPRGKYIVLDGKQRLLSLVRFTEDRDNRKAGFALSGLEARPDLKGARYYDLCHDPRYENDLSAFQNYSVRTMIIRNWPNQDFLHQVFLRLNTGSVKLSPQELRQAMAPGDFTTFADDTAASSDAIKSLLKRKDPDPRMRDVELLVRHLAFINDIGTYRGRMKSFLDTYCINENKHWERRSEALASQCAEFDKAIVGLIEIFGVDRVARKPVSSSFNRAIFDALSFYAADPDVRGRMMGRPEEVVKAYGDLFKSLTRKFRLGNNALR